MIEKVSLRLLILCGIFCHGIIATLSDEVNRESSDLLVREKRVISHLPGESIPSRIEESNYLVNIREGKRAHCAGVILSQHTILTAAICVTGNLPEYRVVSGTGYEAHFTFHNITSKIVHYGDTPHQEFEGIALIRITPPIIFNIKARNIQLHVGALVAGTQVTVTGWGCEYPIRPIPHIKRRLRSITLPIMNHGECQAIYRGRFDITAKHLCTYDEEKYCARTDTGAPLVFNDKLVGIHIYKGEIEHVKNPDVFINLQRTDYSRWIHENTRLM